MTLSADAVRIAACYFSPAFLSEMSLHTNTIKAHGAIFNHVAGNQVNLHNPTPGANHFRHSARLEVH